MTEAKRPAPPPSVVLSPSDAELVRSLDVVQDPSGGKYLRVKSSRVTMFEQELGIWSLLSEMSGDTLAASGYSEPNKTLMMIHGGLFVGDPMVLRKGTRASEWAKSEKKLGRGVLIRGNPLPPNVNRLEVISTPYREVRDLFGGAVLYDTDWRSSSELNSVSEASIASSSRLPYYLMAAGGILLTIFAMTERSQ